MNLVQVVQRKAKVRRLPRGQTPTFEYHLAEHESVVGVLHTWTDQDRRETVDHHQIVWVAVRL